METDYPYFYEFPCGHPPPAVIICISNDKTGEEEEEINRKIAMIYYLSKRSWGMSLKDVEKNDDESGNAP